MFPQIVYLLSLLFANFVRTLLATITPKSFGHLLTSIQGPVPLCSSDSIGLLLPNPSPQWATLLYANRHRNVQPNCSQPFPPNAPLLRLDIQLQFGFPCGVHSRRMTMPRVGLEHSIRLVLAMNGNLAADGELNKTMASTTSMDHLQQRIFDVRCQYFADRNQTVGRVLELSAMSGTFLVEEPSDAAKNKLGKNRGLGHGKQPECKYSIHANSMEGPKADRVQLGDRVFHRWRCGDEYALKVYRCFVHDGRNRRHQIINEKGCSTDLSLMPHPQYSANFSHAIAQSRVFRFNHSARIFFDCLLYACLKSDPECRRATMPKCSTRATLASSRRRRRRRDTSANKIVGVNDEDDGHRQQMVAPPHIEIVALRLEDTNAERENAQNVAEQQLRQALERSQKAVKALAIMNLISLLTAVLLGSALCCQRRRLSTKLAISPKQHR